MATIKLLNNGTLSVRLTHNLSYALSLLCAASLFEKGEDANVRAVYEALPDRESMASETFYRGTRYITNGSFTLRLPVETLWALKSMLRSMAEGGWTTSTAIHDRLDEIEALSTLALLAAAGE